MDEEAKRLNYECNYNIYYIKNVMYQNFNSQTGNQINIDQNIAWHSLDDYVTFFREVKNFTLDQKATKI